MIYFLVFDNTVFIKKYEYLSDLMKESKVGFPYDGAKEHYIVDIENDTLSNATIKK